MGEAARRGTFEERKAKAIKDGRIKRKKEPATRHGPYIGTITPDMFLAGIMARLLATKKKESQETRKK